MIILKKIIKRVLVSLFEINRVLLVRATDKNEVIRFIERLYPMRTSFDLIRLGPNRDGGYLIPNDLEGIECCFSPGVDEMSEFEKDCLQHGIKIYLADKSVEKPNLNISEDKYDFIKMFVGCTNNDDYITMDEWVKSKCESENSELLLQMDIEGGEYSALMNMSDTLMMRFRIMVIEFHLLQELWNPSCFKLIKTVFDKILQNHICVHIHPNNCCGVEYLFGVEIPRVAEFTFLRKDRIKDKAYANEFPHKSDYDNTNKKSIVLPANWYKSK